MASSLAVPPQFQSPACIGAVPCYFAVHGSHTHLPLQAAVPSTEQAEKAAPGKEGCPVHSAGSKYTQADAA
jgi:hypothetical protein